MFKKTRRDVAYINFKALLIIYLFLLIQSLKMASSKPKHVVKFS
jgi:hypothetical protein